MPFEGIPPKTGRVPRAKLLSPEEDRVINSTRDELRAAYDKREGTDLARFDAISRSAPTAERPRVSRQQLDKLSRSYGIQDGPNARRIARENRQELSELLGELREDTRRVVSNDIADKTANEFHTRIRDRHDNRLADRTAAEFRTRLDNRRDAPELSYGDMVDVDIPGSEEPVTELDESDIIGVDSKPRSRGVYDDEVASYIENLPRANGRKTPPPIPEAARNRSRNRDQKELDELLAELNADAAPFAARRAAESRAEQAEHQEVSDLLDEIKQDGLSGAFGARREREAQKARREREAAQAARFERERQEPSVVLDEHMERDPHRMRVRNLKANQAEILDYPHAQARAMNARVDAIGNSFQAKTGVPIEAYLAGTASMMDRARIAAQNIGSAFKQPLQFLKGIFSPGKPTADGAPRELSPQAIIEQYEHARTQAAEAQARLAGAQADAQRLQNQIDELSMPSNEFRAKQDAAWDRAERAKNASILGRRIGPRGAATIIGAERVANTPHVNLDLDLEEDDLEELPEAPTNRAGHHATALRTGHRDRGFNPLTTSPSLRKLAPLYAGPELSRTNAMKGFEEYDNVMDVPGFKDRYDELTERETNEFLSDQPASINPERAPWSDETGPSFADSLETVAGAVSPDRTSGIAIADRAYELLEEDRNPEKAQRAHERFAQLGQHMKHFDAIQKALASREEYEEDMEELVRNPSSMNLRYINAHILSAVDQVGRKNNLPAFQEQRAEIAELFSALLRAKAEASLSQKEENENVSDLPLAA